MQYFCQTSVPLSILYKLYILMVEKAYSCHCHCNAKAVATFNYICIPDRAAGLCNVFNAGFNGSFNIVLKREECVRAKGNQIHFFVPFCFFLFGKRSRPLCEKSFPCIVFKKFFVIIAYVKVYCIIRIAFAYSVNKRKIQHLFILAKPPVICFIACKACAVNTGLLACANADGLPAHCIANGI